MRFFKVVNLVIINAEIKLPNKILQKVVYFNN